MNFNSLVIHGGIDGDKATGSVTVPIYQTSTYAQERVGEHKGYEYSRTGNPTREAAEKLIADLENGYAGFAFGSGMAAISSVLMMFKAGDHIIFSDDVYGGTFRVVDKIFKSFGIEYSFVDTSNIANISNHLQENTKAIYVETPTNPLMKLTDIHAVSKIAKDHDVLLIVDNTFMTPYLQRPIELGANIVLHSATKYLGGHSDLVAGVVVVDSEDLANKMHFVQNAVGAILGPFDSWLLVKGIKTLAVRMDRHCENAAKVVAWLEQQSWVSKIYYPGLQADTIAKGQMKNYGGMISFEVASEEVLEKVLHNLKTIALAESLGGIESLISVSAKMTHASVPKENRDKLGITDTLIRLSVGIEDIEDIISDLDISRK
ncbi:MAG: bifunctional cystathionine gamma-lyase/homocysteine desulfhydrase [Anaerosolibacter sp.]|jgi:cystathionine beta-lyase/cystathionine gamma-synthase|uniref:bifunctional cystathionine gamma-lyase/homocysteine desulfhydrase n=1 Tax=Anaerosolibacter sp. TaxID=1872527 RepID=UPI00260D7976|nr:bifunctional cystathionine gamma-lyase/homocysteine desulfhydrase [Anaerosolibacter sp.]MDF2548187.1 bifunctional cystathionine gamma-lyase/homocysteine desulfhydrase [Anaerosolibacter sp.]